MAIKRQIKVVENEVPKNSSDSLTTLLEKQLPKLLELHGKDLLESALRNTLDGLIDSCMDRLNNDSAFAKKLDEKAKELMLKSFDAVDIKRLSSILEGHTESNIENFEFCDLSEDLTEKFREAIQGIAVTIIPKKK